jgi:hypothetical protein
VLRVALSSALVLGGGPPLCASVAAPLPEYAKSMNSAPSSLALLSPYLSGPVDRGG